MAAEDGKGGTVITLNAIVSKLGARNLFGDHVTPDEWRSLFDVVAELNAPRGWLTAAAEWTNLSRSTIRQRWEKKDTSVHHVGHPPLLPSVLEDALIARAEDQAVIRNGLPQSLLRTTLRTLASMGSNGGRGGSRGHIRGIMHRHPELRSRLAERTKSDRAVALTPEGLAREMDNIESTGIRKVLHDNVINVDESPLLTQKKRVKVIALGSNRLRRVSVRDVSTYKHASLVGACTAGGKRFGKTIIIVKAKKVDTTMVDDRDDCLLIATKSGGMEGHAWEACCNYWASIAEPGDIFLVDGLKAHMDYLANDAMIKKNIKVVTFTPNATELRQVSSAGRSMYCVVQWVVAVIATQRW